MSPIMFLLGAVLGLAVGWVVSRHIKNHAAPAPVRRFVLSSDNEACEFFFDQAYVDDLLVREIRHMLRIPEHRKVDAAITYVSTPTENTWRLSVIVKAMGNGAA